MVDWIKKQMEQMEQRQGKYFKLQDGVNVVSVDITKEPVKREVEGEYGKRTYYDFICVGMDEELFSVTWFLYDQVVTALSKVATGTSTVAYLQINLGRTPEDKTSYDVKVIKTV